MLVSVKEQHTVAVVNRNHGPREPSASPRDRRALLGQHRISVDVLSTETLGGGDKVRTNSLRNEVGVVSGLWVHRPRAAVRTHRHSAHALDAAGDDQLVPTGSNFLGGDIDCLKGGSAESVDLRATDSVGKTGSDRRRLRDVGPLITDRGHTAEDQIVDDVGI